MYLLHENKWKSAAVILALSYFCQVTSSIIITLFFQKLDTKGNRFLQYYYD
jgi:hypothetical protein